MYPSMNSSLNDQCAIQLRRNMKDDNMSRKTDRNLIEKYRVRPGKRLQLAKTDPNDRGQFRNKKDALTMLREDQQRLGALQQVLYAQGKHAILVVLQAMDTGGKDGTIRHVLGPLNPQGVRVASFKKPTTEELAHDYLWRIHRQVPAKGMIGVFNRSHYEDVLVVRVHGLVSKAEVARRYEQINAFEKHLADNGVTIIKFFLNISKDEQKQRLQDRLDRPDKHWKFDSNDLKERKLWDDYMTVYERMLNRCSTPWAPWYVIPANRKWYRNFLVARILRTTMEELHLKFPKPQEGLADLTITD